MQLVVFSTNKLILVHHPKKYLAVQSPRPLKEHNAAPIQIRFAIASTFAQLGCDAYSLLWDLTSIFIVGYGYRLFRKSSGVNIWEL